MQNKLLKALLSITFISGPLTSFGVEQKLSLMTDYRSDGVSQTKNGSAIQWGGTLNHGEFYLNAFASNLRYGDSRGYEFDFGGGKLFDLGKFQWDVGLLNNINISLPAEDSYFWEVYTGVNYNNTSIYFTYADDRQTFDQGKNAKLAFSQSFKLNNAWSWNYQLGYADMYRSRLSDADYVWWKAGLSYSIKRYQFSLNYDDTDIKKTNDWNDIAQQSLSLVLDVSF
ncbi:TorF family putative porin [Aliikangiella sp. IMCC44653]